MNTDEESDLKWVLIASPDSVTKSPKKSLFSDKLERYLVMFRKALFSFTTFQEVKHEKAECLT